MNSSSSCKVDATEKSKTGGGSGSDAALPPLSTVFSDSSSTVHPPPPFLEIEEWNMVGVWTSTEDCTICRAELEDQCRYCLTERYESTAPPLLRGTSSSASSRPNNTSPAPERSRGIQFTFRRDADGPEGNGAVEGNANASSSQSEMGLLYTDERFLPEELALQAREFVCPVVRGSCHHLFHVHCLQAWYRKSTICPLCGVEWRAVAILPTNLKMKELQHILTGKGYTPRSDHKHRKHYHSDSSHKEMGSGRKKHSNYSKN